MHRDSEPDLVFEDMTVMSDFELHCLCREEQVQCKRTLLLIIVLQKEKAIASFQLYPFNVWHGTWAFLCSVTKGILRDR